MRLARHSMTLAWRSLIHTRRTPEELIDVTLQPVLFLVIFTYIFGGAIAAGSQHDYLQFVLPACSGSRSRSAASRSASTSAATSRRASSTASAACRSAARCRSSAPWRPTSCATRS